MRRKTSLTSATLVMLAALALNTAAGSQSHASAGGPANTVTVVINNFKFAPASVTVHAGDIVVWKNEGFVPHTATANGGSQKPAFDSGAIASGGEWRYVARNKGTYNYTCTFHPNMEGKLIVQ
jgi:plastocyanin